ncbi:MAG TPA: hypothetical protein DHV28_16405 [Ignavibacteriales bacterium]|nr:hypothetical protein [Ignavibacteriales bacterium]
MILPTNGSVVIIDEKSDEALPIIKALSKSGISTTYYSGIKEEEFPNPASQIIRLVFLDLQLIDSVTDEHQIATSLVQVLKRIIPPNNGPYILVLWSKNYAKYGAYVEMEIKKGEHGIIPVCIVNLNKSDCLDRVKILTIDPDDFTREIVDSLKGSFEEDQIEFLVQKISKELENQAQFKFQANPNALIIIENAIESKLKEAGVFHLFTIWENLLKSSGANIVTEISSTMESSVLWEQNMRDVIKRMAEARTGQNNITKEIALEASMATLTNSFAEELESKTRGFHFPDYIQLESPFNIASYCEENILKIVKFEGEGKTKVKLLKNGEIVKGKEGLKIDSISKLSEGLKDPDKTVVDKITKAYINVPHFINTKLHIELNPSNVLIPGNLYKINLSTKDKENFVKPFFEKLPENIKEYKIIELEVSPICDYAQNKWKKSRLLPGVLYPAEVTNLRPGNHYYPVSPAIIIDKKPYKMIFDFHLFKSLDKTVVNKRKVFFKLKRELLLDIIANLSGHVNRPGIAFVS